MKILAAKLKEALLSILPITAIIIIINFAVSPMPRYNLISFLFGALLLICGTALYSLGGEISIEPIGHHIGSRITKTKKLSVILPICFLIGVIVTIAEPDLTVLAELVPTVDNWTLILTVAVGVGVFLLFSVLRIALKVPLRYVLIFFYGALFLLAAFVDAEFVPLAFDSGGVTTGPITVPFIMALGIGISAVLGGNNSQDSSFGIIGICSIGPIIAVLLLGLFYAPEGAAGVEKMLEFSSVGDVFAAYARFFPIYLRETFVALAPILGVFLIFRVFALKMPHVELIRILIGAIYTCVGLAIFLTGVNIGFMSAGTYIGAELAIMNKWLLVPVGMIVGAFIVLAEPAVHVLNVQVEEITGGTIKKSTMLTVLAIAIASAIGLSMLRVATGISIWFIILPGYAIALALSFFVPKIFTAVAFDSGGVASGPMTTTFLLPLALGAADALPGANLLTDAFGIVATVAMTPLVAVQVLGLIYKLKVNAQNKRVSMAWKKMLSLEGEQVIDFTVDNKAEEVMFEESSKSGKISTVRRVKRENNGTK